MSTTVSPVVETWDEVLAETAEGLDFSDSEDRAIFRTMMDRRLQHAKLTVVEAWLAARAPGLKMPNNRNQAVRMMADVYMKHIPVPPAGTPAVTPRKTPTPRSGDVTDRLSRAARDAGFTLTSTPLRDTETGGTYYEYTLYRHGDPVSTGGSLLNTLPQVEAHVRMLLLKEKKTSAKPE